MPKGELRFSRNGVRSSATPSPLASRSSVMRLALGTPAPAFFMKYPMAFALMPLLSSGRGGALVSATSTSPFGSTWIQRAAPPRGQQGHQGEGHGVLHEKSEEHTSE